MGGLGRWGSRGRGPEDLLKSCVVFTAILLLTLTGFYEVTKNTQKKIYIFAFSELLAFGGLTLILFSPRRYKAIDLARTSKKNHEYWKEEVKIKVLHVYYFTHSLYYMFIKIKRVTRTRRPACLSKQGH